MALRRSADYREGEAEGLRIAAEAIRDLERSVAERLEQPAERRTRDARRVRHKALQKAARRVESELRKRSKPEARLEAQLRRIGL